MMSTFVILGLVWFVRVIIAAVKRTPERRLVRLHYRYFILIPAMLGFALVLGGSSALLTLRVYLSSTAMTQATVVDGPDDRWIGLFHVRESWRFGTEVRFLTNGCGLVDDCGVVFSPDGPPARRGEDSFSHLYGPWWHWYQSW